MYQAKQFGAAETSAGRVVWSSFRTYRGQTGRPAHSGFDTLANSRKLLNRRLLTCARDEDGLKRNSAKVTSREERARRVRV